MRVDIFAYNTMLTLLLGLCFLRPPLSNCLNAAVKILYDGNKISLYKCLLT